MSPDNLSFAACAVLALVIALPSWQALRRRSLSRESSAVAAALAAFAADQRRAGSGLSLDEALLVRLRRLEIPETFSLEFARELSQPPPELLADTTQRLALRLKRRVAFERKMLARTASGRRRATLAAACCIVTLLGLQFVGLAPPPFLLALVSVLAVIGGILCCRVARVEV
jgi:hypothetical protein